MSFVIAYLVTTGLLYLGILSINLGVTLSFGGEWRNVFKRNELLGILFIALPVAAPLAFSYIQVYPIGGV